MITQHQLRSLGHLVRMPSGPLPRKVLYGQLHLLQPYYAGGQKKHYKDHLKTALRKSKIRHEALEAMHSGGGEDSQKTGEKEHTYGCPCHHHHHIYVSYLQ